MQTEEKKTRHKINKTLAATSAVRVEVKKAKPSRLKLGDETIPIVPPNDIEVMFLGKALDLLGNQQVRMENTLSGMLRAYGEDKMKETVKENLERYIKSFKADFDRTKRQVTRIVDMHPLAEKLCKIRGFTSYQLAMIMAEIKDPKRFPSPSNLFVYAGVAPRNGIAVVKANIPLLRMQKHEEYAGEKPDDFKEFGFNTTLSKRLYVAGESLIKQKGFFYYQYSNMKPRLQEYAINTGKTFVATEEDRKKSNGVMEVGKRYMVDRKNFSLDMWSHKNAFKRIQKLLLHFIWCEWCSMVGYEPRELYVIEYLGHKSKITLDECLRYEAGQKMLEDLSSDDLN